MPLLYEELTGKILEACLEVSNELGAGFVEAVYEHALLIALRLKGLQAHTQVPITVQFRGREVGQFYADIVVEDKAKSSSNSKLYPSLPVNTKHRLSTT